MMSSTILLQLSVCLVSVLPLRADVYWRNVSGEMEAAESIPQGAASLVFVFDTTGSMSDDLVQAIDGAAKILEVTLTRREKPLYNYILVPFNDPEVGPVTVTTDPDKFQHDLRNLKVDGGGDCPEMSVTAIKLALQESLPNSFIYVFTDASAKDHNVTEQVLTLIQHKQSQVVFVLTGDCSDVTHPGYKAYEQVAAKSSGQIFRLEKSQINQVLDFVRVSLQSRNLNLMSKDRGISDGVLVYELPVDTKLQEFTISVSGELPQVSITNPDGVILTSSNGLNTLVSLRNVLILNVKGPKPGKWTLRISGQGQHMVKITGLSSLDFVYGFSSRSTQVFTETDARPLKGIPTYLLINATDLDSPGRINKLELVNLHGNVLVEIPIQYYSAGPLLDNVSAFIPPQDSFYIKVVGIDSQGFTFQRTTTTTISPIDPKPPSVQMPSQTHGFYDEVAILDCSIISLVPFAVQWYRKAEVIGSPIFYSESANTTWSIPDASSSSEGYYTCNATIGASWAAATTYLDIRVSPPKIVKPLDVYVIPGHDAVLTCVAKSRVEFNMTWFRHNANESLYTPLVLRGEIFSNGSAIIRKVERSDEGRYVCRASNEVGHRDENVSLIIVHTTAAQESSGVGIGIGLGIGFLSATLLVSIVFVNFANL